MIEACDPPSGLEDQARDLGQFGEITLIDGIRGLVIVHMGAIEIKDDRNTVLGIIPLIGAVVDHLWIVGIVVMIIQGQCLVFGVGWLTDLMKLFDAAVCPY